MILKARGHTLRIPVWLMLATKQVMLSSIKNRHSKLSCLLDGNDYLVRVEENGNTEVELLGLTLKVIPAIRDQVRVHAARNRELICSFKMSVAGDILKITFLKPSLVHLAW